jgi:hypothetical protein
MSAVAARCETATCATGSSGAAHAANPAANMPAAATPEIFRVNVDIALSSKRIMDHAKIDRKIGLFGAES